MSMSPAMRKGHSWSSTAMGSANVSNCLTKSVKYELLFIPRAYGLSFDHFRWYRVCFFDFFPVYVKSIISTSEIWEYVRNVECYNDRGWTVKGRCRDSHKFIFLWMQGCSYQAGAIILKKKIVNCEICLRIVSIFCSTEKLLRQMALC